MRNCDTVFDHPRPDGVTIHDLLNVPIRHSGIVDRLPAQNRREQQEQKSNCLPCCSSGLPCMVLGRTIAVDLLICVGLYSSS